MRGIIAAMRGDDAAAEEAFRRADAIARDGTARYNLALVLLRRGNARAAIAEVRRAMDEFELRGRGGERARVLSLMEMLTGSARLLEGDETGARAAFGRSLALDARNLRAGLLLRKLEAGEQ
jgi:tetratricopeptide (TPR) repeat protein